MSRRATKPPEPLCPLWKIPAPAISTGGYGMIGCTSRNGTVLCAASLRRSLGAKFRYWFIAESGILSESWIGISGSLSFSSVLKGRGSNVLINGVRGRERCLIYDVSHLSVTSLLCQKLFFSGSTNNPDVKLNGVAMISKFKRLPTIRNRMPE